MSTVMSVTGPIEAEQLGFTLMHEHLYVDIRRDQWNLENITNDPDLVYSELMQYVNAGGVTLVDQTSNGLKGVDQPLFSTKHPLAIKEMAERTGLQIILGSGWYRESYYEPYLYKATTDQIAEEIVGEVTQGIDGTDVRAGIIGEIGSHFSWVSPAEERVFRAAARAQKETGVTLVTHSPQEAGLQQLKIMIEEGADPSRIVVGHSQSYPHHDYHAEIARLGAYLSFDSMGSLKTGNDYDRGVLLRLIRQIIDAGLIDRLLFSHDVCRKGHYTTHGGVGYSYVSTLLFDDLRQIDFTEEQFQQIMIENPRRALTGGD